MSPQPERWLPVPGAPNYSVSDLGNVRSEPRPRAKAGLLTQRKKHNGEYLLVWMMSEGKPKVFSVHRLVLLAFVGPCPDRMEGRHLNGVATDNRLENLTWSTHAENIADKDLHGTNYQRNKTECPKGHPYEGHNLILERNGHRKCRTCKRDRENRRLARHRQETLDLVPEAPAPDGG